MIKKFNDTAILTTQNPEAFIVYEHVAGDPSYYIVPICNNGDSTQLYVNGLKPQVDPGLIFDPSYYIYTGQAVQLNGDASVAAFHLFTQDISNFDVSVHFYVCSALSPLTVSSSDHIRVYNRPNIYDNAVNVLEDANMMIDDKSSYLVLRSNPAFSGNIKLVVDTSDNMFIDTFKISDVLSNKKYRKQKVSANSVWSSDIRNVFSSLPLGELYKNDIDNTLNVEIPKTDLYSQYEMTYNYGAYVFTDDLYDQESAILAPLWMNIELPDHFCIFRMDGVYNPETYVANSSTSNFIVKYLKNSDIIKTWNLKSQYPLGKYLATHMNDVKAYPAPTFLSLTEPDVVYAESDPNTWYGIAVDKGVVTGRSETPYFFNQNLDNLTKLNAFVSQGFERNNLLCPNLINLEFIFNDEDVSLYTMNRYFGLYMKENVLYNVGYYSSDDTLSDLQLLSLDEKDPEQFIDSSIFSINKDVRDDYQNRIFVINDGIKLKRITSKNQLTEISEVSSYASKPQNNLFTSKVELRDITPFISIHLNKKLNQGEHLRIINRNLNKIWELYGINREFNCEPYVSSFSNPGYPTIYQTTFSTIGNIADQIVSIENAIDRFSNYEDSYFRAGIRGSDWVSIIINNNDVSSWEFQRITSQTQVNPINPNSPFNSSARPEDMTFFGRFTPSASDFATVDSSATYGPINFELYGKRKSITVPFVDKGGNHLYNFLEEYVDKFTTVMLYQNENGWYNKIINFDVSNNSYQYVKDPLKSTGYLIQTENLINTYKDSWNAYNLYPLSISIMSINPVKDIDYTIYDSCIGFKSEYWYNRECDASTYEFVIKSGERRTVEPKSSYVITQGFGLLQVNGSSYNYTTNTVFNTYDTSAVITCMSLGDTIVSYPMLDGSLNVKSYDASISEQDVSDYFYSNKLLNYSLTSPTVSQWVNIGTDCRNNDLRLVLSNNIFSDASSFSNFIPTTNSYSDEISYPVYKYLTPGANNWKDYVYYDINDVIKYTDGQTYYYTIKELMFEKPYLDIFSKMIYANKDTDKVKNRSSLLYYNEYKNTVDTIFLGLSLSISIKDVAQTILDVKNYDRYRFSFVSTSSKNKDTRKPFEIIINENTGTVLCVWYQGSDVLTYSKRNSSYVPGKSLLDASNGTAREIRSFVTAPDTSIYSFIKAPFVVNNSTVQKTTVNLYSFNYTVADSSLIRPYAQLNSGNGVNSAWIAYSINNTLSQLGSKFYFSTSQSYNTFNQSSVNYSYSNNINTFGDNVTNYSYKFGTSENIFKNNTTNFNTLSSILNDENNYVSVYGIRDNYVISNNSFNSCPIKIVINYPRSINGISTYNGWYKPKFNTVLDFNYNEDKEIVNILQKDFVFSNTNVKENKDIEQMWYNKVVSQVESNDVLAGNAVDFKQNFSVFKSLWDASYYMYRSSNTSGYYPVSGYESGKELPSFFGSKIVKLPNQLTLDNWNATTLYYKNEQTYVISINVTRAISNLFISNLTFVNNWSGLSNAGKYISSYIKNTILSYYDISFSKVKSDVYHKPFSNDVLSYVYDSEFTLDDKQNFISEVVVENGEYIYKLYIPKENNYTYFIRLILTKK